RRGGAPNLVAPERDFNGGRVRPRRRALRTHFRRKTGEKGRAGEACGLLKDAVRSFPIMEISKGAIGILAAVCVVGGAGTAYYATRDQAAPPPATTSAPAISPDPAVTQVEQSEGVVSDA